MMKRIIVSILLASVCVTLLVSCRNGSGQPSGTVKPDGGYVAPEDGDGLDGVFLPQLSPESWLKLDGDYLYYRSDGSFRRLNMKTGLCTDVCGDPLCTHGGGDCPFYNMSAYFIHDNCVWYKSETAVIDTADGIPRSIRRQSIYKYDIGGQKRTLIKEIPDDGTGYYMLGIFDGYLYYVRSQYKENVGTATGEGDYLRSFCRCIPERLGDTGKEEVLLEMKNEKQGDLRNVYYMTDDAVFFSVAGEEEQLIRADRALTKFETLKFDYYINTGRLGDYAYFLKCGDEVLDTVTSTDGKGNTILNEDGTPRLTPLYGLYYTKRNLLTGEDTRLSDYIVGIRYYGGMADKLTAKYLYLELEDGLWRCDHDGNRIKLVRTKEQKENNPVGIGYGTELIYGNYIYTISGDKGEISRFDMTGGEYTVLQ